MAREQSGGKGVRWRLWLVPAAALGLCASAAWGAWALRRYALADPEFALGRGGSDPIVIQGLVYTPRWKVLQVFDADLGRSVFAIPLAERRRRLLAINWVEDASVTRLLPDRLLVRIRERRPVAFAVFPSGALLVDAAGVLLEPPAQARLAFPALSGLPAEASAGERLERVKAFLRFQQDMGYLADSVSEVDVSDPADLRVVAETGGRAVELRMGDGDFAHRYQTFVNNYPEIHSRSPEASSFDLRLEGRITAR